jgi:pyruvate kinase
MRRMRHTKIVATLGPASTDPAIIRALFEAGADVFRLNFSHGDHGEHRARHKAIRELEAAVGHPIGILVDLQGPKLRVGAIEGGEVVLAAGAPFRLDLGDRLGDSCRVCLPHREVYSVLKPGIDLLLDDGRIRLRVVDAGTDFVDTEVVTGGRLSDRKGVNVPDAVLPFSALSAKDRADLEFAVNLGVDWIGLSFVQRPEDVAEARKLIAGRAAVMAKIEKPSAVGRIDEIIELADAIMVARGDLGVEMPLQEVPRVQKNLVRVARRAGKPVVVATQMLESMVHSPVPTRAEVSDVATAVYDGADAVMLSAETASGRYPVEAVTVESEVATEVERDPVYRSLIEAGRSEPESTAADAITAAARQVADTIDAAAIVTFTTSGSTALRAARERPDKQILGLTPNHATARRLSIAWGIHCVYTEDARDVDDMVDKSCRTAYQQGFAKPGQRLVITAGVPFGTPGATNLLRIAWVDAGRR